MEDFITVQLAEVERRRITKRSFFNRITPSEERAIRAARDAAPSVLLRADLARLIARIDASPWVDLKLAETREGVQWLASPLVPESIEIEGVTLALRLAPHRPAEILDSPITDEEEYRG